MVNESHRVDHVPAHQDQDEIVAVGVVIVADEIEAETEDDHREEIEMMMGHENSGVDRAMIMTMRPSFAQDHAKIVQTTIVKDKEKGVQEIDHDHSATIDVAMIDPAEMIGAAMTGGATIAARVLNFRVFVFSYVSWHFNPFFFLFCQRFFVLYIFAIFSLFTILY